MGCMERAPKAPMQRYIESREMAMAEDDMRREERIEMKKTK